MSGISRVDERFFLASWHSLSSAFLTQGNMLVSTWIVADQSELESTGSFDSLRWKTVDGELATLFPAWQCGLRVVTFVTHLRAITN
jgi:hypothetical protein